MRNKTVAAVFAFFLGSLGVHRFYLGQIGLGILYLLLSWTMISTILGIIDGISFLSMDNVDFDAKYNGKKGYDRGERRYEQRERRQGRRYEQQSSKQHRNRNRNYSQPPITRTNRKISKHNPHKESGIEKYKEYDFEDAIVDFNKALVISPNDVAVHFNIACAYSITENAEKAFHHLSKAVELGFADMEKIKEHDALAYIRIQDEFEAFAKNGYRLQVQQTETAQPAPEISEDLLEQIKRLGELREKGFLTQDEFLAQKRKLLR